MHVHSLSGPPDPSRTRAAGEGGAGDRPAPEWQSAVREVMDDVAERRARRPRPLRTARWQPLVLGVLSALFVGVGIWNILWYQDFHRPAFSAAQVEESLRASIFLTVLGLESHRSRTGTYPASLEEVGLDAPDLEYRLEGQEFVLLAPGLNVEPPLSYRPGEDLRPFELALDGVLPANFRRGA